MSKVEEFLRIAKPDDQGWSPKISFASLPKSLQPNNGAHWCRASSSIAKQYKVKLFKEGKGNKNTHIQLQGHREDDGRRQTIAPWIYKELLTKDANCCICHSKIDLEIDHKNGRKDDSAMHVATQIRGDFQVLCRRCNQKKRQICKDCKKTDQRYDARRDGYHVPVTAGSLMYEGTCDGCKYYDPPQFNSRFSLTVLT